MKALLSIFVLLFLSSCSQTASSESDLAAIRTILEEQQAAWSNHDLEGFMQGYWKSDSLTYYSRGKVSQGWQATLDKYKKGYPTPAETGNLKFKIAKIEEINKDAYWVMGEYHLTRQAGDTNGTFMIVFKRINGEWKIVADSSC